MLGGQSSESHTPNKVRQLPKISQDLRKTQQDFTSKIAQAVPNLRPDQDSTTKTTVIPSAQESVKSPIALLEDTFVAYLIALRLQSGNMVGKKLLGRASADELLVNEIYNTLLEDPSRISLAAEAPTDVLFVAFEKFIRRAWREVSIRTYSLKSQSEAMGRKHTDVLNQISAWDLWSCQQRFSDFSRLWKAADPPHSRRSSES